MQDCRDNQVQTALDIPYFHNDFWPYTIEKSIQGLFPLLIIRKQKQNFIVYRT